MQKHARPLPYAALATTLILAAAPARAAPADDAARAELTLRNYFFSRNFVGDARRDRAEEWSQSFILELDSGLHDGPGSLELGLEALGLWSLKLDGGRGTRGTRLLPVDHDGRPADEFGRLALAARLRLADTELRIGEWRPQLPVLRADDSRSLPQTFRGAMLSSRAFDRLTLHAGQMRATSPNDDDRLEDLRLQGFPEASSGRFDFAGLGYALNDGRSRIDTWYARLRDIYRQRYVQLSHLQPLGRGWSLGARLGYADGEEDGEARAGELDNRVLSGLFSLSGGPHRIYLGLQRAAGDSAWLRLEGTSGATLANSTYYAGERSWQLRHDYDFAGIGLPGLTLMNRYTRGRDIHDKGIVDGREWARESELGYVLQSGPLRGLELRWRYSSYRRDWGVGKSYDEQRLRISYPLALF